MTVIPFPILPNWDAPIDRAPATLIRLIAVLQFLGEPAAGNEIADMLTLCSQPVCPSEVCALLDIYCSPQPAFSRRIVFRRVHLQGREAWAFTSEFRSLLRLYGLAPLLRALPLADPLPMTRPAGWWLSEEATA